MLICLQLAFLEKKAATAVRTQMGLTHPHLHRAFHVEVLYILFITITASVLKT